MKMSQKLPLLLIFGVKDSLNLSVGLVSAQPFPTVKDGGDRVGGVGHKYHPLLGWWQSCSIFTLSSLPRSGISKTKRFVFPRSKMLRNFCFRVPVDAIEGNEDVGVCACSFYVPCDDNDFILDRKKAAVALLAKLSTDL